MIINFCPHFAAKYSLEESILISVIKDNITHNKINSRFFYEERTWSYFNWEGFCRLLSFWDVKQIDQIFNQLVFKKILIRKNIANKNEGEGNWYAFADEEKFIKI